MTGYIGDGGIQILTGTVSMNNQGYGNVQTGPSDASMLVIFYKRPVHNLIKSAHEGRPIYEDVDHVMIQQPGEGNLQKVDRPVKQEDTQRWPAQWHAYSAGKDQVAEGTPLGLLFPRHPSAIMMLQGLGIMTVEHLANASATAIAAIGMNGQDYVNYAQKYISGASSGAAFHQMQMELEQSKRDNTRMAKQVEEMQHQMTLLNQALIGGVGTTPMPGISRQASQVGPAPAQTMPGGSMPRAPSFGGSAIVDVQTEQINANHPMADQAPKKGGWPKGKPRKPAAA